MGAREAMPQSLAKIYIHLIFSTKNRGYGINSRAPSGRGQFVASYPGQRLGRCPGL